METLATTEPASPDTEREFHLLLERDRAGDWLRWRRAGVISLAAHVVLIVTLFLIPESATTVRVYETPPVRVLTHLVTPTDLTQTAPNKAPLSKELSVAAEAPVPVLKAPSPPPPAKRVPASAPLPPQVAKSQPKLVITEPPKLQTENPNPQLPDQIARLNVPTPLPPATQQPRIVFENAGQSGGQPVQGNPQAKVKLPDASVDAVVRDLSKTGALGSQSVGDVGEDDAGTGLGINLPPSAGKPTTNMELRSDPMGVDFRPYMTQIIRAIKRNWLAVYPEAARLGQRGETVLLFAIERQGVVVKVSFSTESGAKALDQAAVAAISASNPLPPLPKNFRGDRIVLRMTFKYNMPR